MIYKHRKRKLIKTQKIFKLQNLTEHCKYDEQLKGMLRYRLIYGIKHELTLMRLLSQCSSLTLQLRKTCPIRNYSAPHFPAFGLNTEIYGLFSPNAGKCGPE